LLAAGLGALHALSPGHGKTVMAAYLVGSSGTARHAVILGLVVTMSHTMGVLALALVTLLAADTLPPERLYPMLGLSSGAIVIGIGIWLLVSRWRALAAERAHRRDHRQGIGHGHGHGKGREYDPSRTTLSWRALFSLGLAGGLVPSASALLLLLGAIAVGRPEYGLALVVAFGAGMAVVLSGIGILMVHAAHLIERVPRLHSLSRLAPALPWVTAVLVLAAGLYLTGQALARQL
jgi:nickel/cobalt transporter (NicO) family protein